MRWLENLSATIQYIEEHLQEDISHEELAKIACCSSAYFQRVFSYITDISLSEYIRRRRMTQAGFDLQSTNEKVIDIALKYGYTSPTSFTRAFYSVHNMAPSKARTHGHLLSAYLPITLSIEVKGGENMKYQIQEKESIRIIGKRIPITGDMDNSHTVVPKFWQEMIKTKKLTEIRKLANQSMPVLLGVTEYQKNDIYYYIGVPSTMPIPKGMHACYLPETSWVIFENDGHFQESVQMIFKRFLMEWLPFSGYSHAGLPDIEVYPLEDNKEASGHTEVWIAIKKEKE